MKLKLDESGNVVVQDGKPVYVYEDGKEVAVDAPTLFTKVKELNEESKGHRLKAKELEDKLAKFGDVDPDNIKTFLDEVDKMGGIETVKAAMSGEGKPDVAKIKKEMEEAYTAHRAKLEEVYNNKLSEKEKLLQEKDGHIYKLEVSNRFKSSPLMEKLVLPPDLAEAAFGQAFKIEEGKVVGYLNGTKIYSREKAGELADFDEAFAQIIEAYPGKDRILKGSGASGSGASGNNGSGTFGRQTISRAEFSQLPPAQQSKLAISGVQITE